MQDITSVQSMIGHPVCIYQAVYEAFIWFHKGCENIINSQFLKLAPYQDSSNNKGYSETDIITYLLIIIYLFHFLPGMCEHAVDFTFVNIFTCSSNCSTVQASLIIYRGLFRRTLFRWKVRNMIHEFWNGCNI